MHGLGENKSGLNYLFSELSHGLCEEGYTVYRFDLGGCGESVLPLSLNIWKEQLGSVQNFLKQKYSRVHLIARGSASLLLPRDESSIAIGPIYDELFLKHYMTLPVEDCPINWIPKIENPLSLEKEYFWFSLGVEAGCLGGFYVPRNFINELPLWLKPLAKEWTVICAGKECPIASTSIDCYLPDCHPLFFQQSDRRILLEKIKGLLSQDQLTWRHKDDNNVI